MIKRRPHVLITGGSRGIGAACAERFAAEGYSVTVLYKSRRGRAEDLAERLRETGADILPICADIRKEEEVRAAVTTANLQFGAVDILVSNAGIASQKLITDVSSEEFRDMLETHVTGLFHAVQAVLPGMIARKRGTIVTISSIWGLTGASCEVAYSTAKAAVIGFTKALAKEVGPSGITVNCVAPGVIDTDMNALLNDEDIASLCDETPLGRIGTAQEVADAVFFLASERSSFITGQVLSPNGGIVI